MNGSIGIYFFLLFSIPTWAQVNYLCDKPAEIKTYFQKRGFRAIPIEILGHASMIRYEDYIDDYAELAISRDGKEVDVSTFISGDLQKSLSEGLLAKAIITSNDNFCDRFTVDIISADYHKKQYDASINIHIWKDPEEKQDLLFFRLNMDGMKR